MNAATDRVNRIHAIGLAEAFAGIREAVWWITVVDDNVRARDGKAYSRAARATLPRQCAAFGQPTTGSATKSRSSTSGGKLLGQVLGQVADAPPGILRTGEHATARRAAVLRGGRLAEY